MSDIKSDKRQRAEADAPELQSSADKNRQVGKVTNITSRNRDFFWDPIAIPTSLTGFSQRVSNLKVSIIEQTARR